MTGIKAMPLCISETIFAWSKSFYLPEKKYIFLPFFKVHTTTPQLQSQSCGAH